jgi:FADH2 O2-dependent halogenase
VLRFNNGITSAGVMYSGNRSPKNEAKPAQEWAELLERYPSVGRQFARAHATRPFVRTGRIQRRVEQAGGEDWAMLAHAAYFIDPLLSSGNAHSLLTIQRLGQILSNHWDQPSLKSELAKYNAALQREIDFVDQLVDGCYQSFRRFDLLGPYTMYYFAGAIRAEERRRAGLADEHDEFLSSNESGFRRGVENGYQRLRELALAPYCERSSQEFERSVACDIESYNSAGLCDPAKRNMYPFTCAIQVGES